MKIIIDIPERIVKYAASTLHLIFDEEVGEGKIDEVISSMNEEPFILDPDYTSDSKSKQLVAGIAMIAIANKIEKTIE